MRVRCPGISATPAWDAACRAIARHPRRFTNARETPGCFGPFPAIAVRVTGTIDGRRIDIAQSGMCGPPGGFAWYPLLAAPHPPVALPGWLQAYLAT